MTKEQILDKHSDKVNTGSASKWVFDAMDEYAKQQAIAYNKWYNSIGVLARAFRDDDDLYKEFEQQNKDNDK